MKNITPIIIGLVSLPALAYAAMPLLTTSGDTERGQEIYEETCIACHGPDGSGALPGITPDFTAKDGPLSQSDEVLIEHITDGFQSPGSQMAMPPLGGNDELTEEDVQAVLDYLKHEFYGE